MFRHRFFALLASFVVSAGCFTTPLRAQGLASGDRAAVKTLPALGAAATVRDGRRPAVVDLRRNLPPVGLQSMNDCAAWAFGYAARTYLEVIDQGWKPDTYDHIFSPTFIYNQVNHGKDSGSNPNEVLQLLASKGAATLATLPYHPKDFQYVPPTAAFDEAKAFPIEGAFELKNGEEIRDALAEGFVVVIGVRTNPVFNSGRYPLYTAAMHESARLARKPGQPHGYHAMVICGYSDERRAFLFMNSWGTNWGEDGFVWISYDVVDVFNGSGVTENLMDFALVLADRREVVSKENGHFEKVAVGAIAPHGSGWFTGLAANQAPRFHFIFDLMGPRDVLARIRQVTWTYHDASGDHTLTSPHAVVGFCVSGETEDRHLPFNAHLEYENGTTRDLPGALNLPPAGQSRQVKINRVDQFSRFDPDTHAPNWYVAFYPELDEHDWQDLVQVDYSGLNVAAPNAVCENPSDPNARGLVDWRHDACLVPPEGVVKLRFKDNTVYEVAVPHGPFTTPARDEGSLTAVVRHEGRDAGHDWYYYETQLHLPHAWYPADFANVSLRTGSSYDPEENSGRYVESHGTWLYVHDGFTDLPMEVSAWLSFRSHLTSDPRNGGPPITVKLGNEPSPDTSRGIYLSYSDTYAGIVNGAPTWNYHVSLYELAGVPVLQKITWHVPGNSPLKKDPVPPGADEGPGSRAISFAAGATPIEVTAELTFEPDGNGQTAPPLTVRRVVQPATRPNDAFALIAINGIRERALGGAPNTGFAEVSINGPAEVAVGVRQVESLFRTPWGGQDRLASANAGRLMPLERLTLRVPHPDLAKPAEAIVTFEDESRMTLRTAVRPNSPFIYPNRLQLEARERFLGSDHQTPRWAGRLRIAGDDELTQAIDHVTYHAIAIDGQVVPVIPSRKPREANVVTGEPLRISAEVFFTAASGFAPMTVETTMRTAAPRAPADLQFAVEPVWRPKHHWKPNDTIADMPDPEIPQVLHLVGPARVLASVRSVTYSVQHDGEPADNFQATVTTRSAEAIDGFPARHTPLLGKNTFTAKVQYADGTTRSFTADYTQELEPPAPPPALSHRLRYWGEENGQDAYLISYRVQPDEDQRAVKFEVEGKNHRMLWPQDISYAYPEFAWDYVAWGDDHLKGARAYQPTYEGSTEAESQSLDLEPAELAPLPRPPAIKQPRLEVLPDPAKEPLVCFVRVVAPEKLLAGVERAEFDVEQDGKTRTLRPFDRFGETGDSFDCRIVGPAPTRITARLIDGNQRPVGEPLRWTR